MAVAAAPDGACSGGPAVDPWESSVAVVRRLDGAQSPEELIALSVLAEADGACSRAEAATWIGLHPNTIGRALGKLADRGLVVRERRGRYRLCDQLAADLRADRDEAKARSDGQPNHGHEWRAPVVGVVDRRLLEAIASGRNSAGRIVTYAAIQGHDHRQRVAWRRSRDAGEPPRRYDQTLEQMSASVGRVLAAETIREHVARLVDLGLVVTRRITRGPSLVYQRRRAIAWNEWRKRRSEVPEDRSEFTPQSTQLPAGSTQLPPGSTQLPGHLEARDLEESSSATPPIRLLGEGPAAPDDDASASVRVPERIDPGRYLVDLERRARRAKQAGDLGGVDQLVDEVAGHELAERVAPDFARLALLTAAGVHVGDDTTAGVVFGLRDRRRATATRIRERFGDPIRLAEWLRALLADPERRGELSQDGTSVGAYVLRCLEHDEAAPAREDGRARTYEPGTVSAKHEKRGTSPLPDAVWDQLPAEQVETRDRVRGLVAAVAGVATFEAEARTYWRLRRRGDHVAAAAMLELVRAQVGDSIETARVLGVGAAQVATEIALFCRLSEAARAAATDRARAAA